MIRKLLFAAFLLAATTTSLSAQEAVTPENRLIALRHQLAESVSVKEQRTILQQMTSTGTFVAMTSSHSSVRHPSKATSATSTASTSPDGKASSRTPSPANR